MSNSMLPTPIDSSWLVSPNIISLAPVGIAWIRLSNKATSTIEPSSSMTKSVSRGKYSL